MSTTYESGTVPPILVRHRLRIAREYAALEQGELAEMIGVSRNTISNAESGRVSPRRIVVNAWALACGVPVSWLTTGAGSSPGNDGPAVEQTGSAVKFLPPVHQPNGLRPPGKQAQPAVMFFTRQAA